MPILRAVKVCAIQTSSVRQSRARRLCAGALRRVGDPAATAEALLFLGRVLGKVKS